MIVAPYSWIAKWADACTEGYECPFEALHLIPLIDMPGGFYEIVGLRQGGERSVRIPQDRLGEIARDHLRSRHGVTDPLDATLEQSGHAMAIAAVACLMD